LRVITTTLVRRVSALEVRGARNRPVLFACERLLDGDVARCGERAQLTFVALDCAALRRVPWWRHERRKRAPVAAQFLQALLHQSRKLAVKAVAVDDPTRTRKRPTNHQRRIRSQAVIRMKQAKRKEHVVRCFVRDCRSQRGGDLLYGRPTRILRIQEIQPHRIGIEQKEGEQILFLAGRHDLVGMLESRQSVPVGKRTVLRRTGEYRDHAGAGMSCE
jgi:hypothetical protein